MSENQSTPRDPKKYLHDIAEACELIIQFAGNSSLEEYLNDVKGKFACLMQFVIIGEALIRLRDKHPNIFANVTDGQRIIDFRNIIVHGYDVINDEMVWQIIQEKVAILLADVVKELEDV